MYIFSAVSDPSSSWSTRLLHTLRTCMAVMRPSSRNAQVGIFTRGPTDTTLVLQKCASCWSGARRMARGCFLVRFPGRRNRRSQLQRICPHWHGLESVLGKVGCSIKASLSMKSVYTTVANTRQTSSLGTLRCRTLRVYVYSHTTSQRDAFI